MKNRFIKALETLQERFVWSENNGANEKTVKQNRQIYLALNEYFETMEKREMEWFEVYNRIHVQVKKRNYFIRLHGYSDFVIEWIEQANIDFLKSEIEYRRQHNRPLDSRSYLSWIDLLANERIVIKKADSDIEEFKKFNENVRTQATVKQAYPHINFAGTMPERNQLIKFHSYRYDLN
jgi:hypothetical protein